MKSDWQSCGTCMRLPIGGKIRPKKMLARTKTRNTEPNGDLKKGSWGTRAQPMECSWSDSVQRDNSEHSVSPMALGPGHKRGNKHVITVAE